MMNCNQCREHLLAYAYGELPEEKIKAFESALESCDDCQQELERIRMVRGLLREAMPAAEPPAMLRANILREARLGAYAVQESRAESLLDRIQALLFHPGFATVAATVLVVVGVVYVTQDHTAQESSLEATSEKASVSPKKEKETALAAAEEEEMPQALKKDAQVPTPDAVADRGRAGAPKEGKKGEAAFFDSEFGEDKKRKAKPAALGNVQKRPADNKPTETDRVQEVAVTEAPAQQAPADARETERRIRQESRAYNPGRQVEEARVAGNMADNFEVESGAKEQAELDTNKLSRAKSYEGGDKLADLSAAKDAPTEDAPAKPEPEPAPPVAKADDPMPQRALEDNKYLYDAAPNEVQAQRDGDDQVQGEVWNSDGVVQNDSVAGEAGSARGGSIAPGNALNSDPGSMSNSGLGINSGGGVTYGNDEGQYYYRTDDAEVVEKKAESDKADKDLEEQDAEDDTEELYASGYNRYMRGDNAGAIRDFNAFMNDAPSSSNYHALALFFRGMSFYRQGQYQAAAQSFRSVLNQHPGSEKRQEARYYMALSLLRLDPDNQEAKDILESLMQGSGGLGNRAREAHGEYFGGNRSNSRKEPARRRKNTAAKPAKKAPAPAPSRDDQYEAPLDVE